MEISRPRLVAGESGKVFALVTKWKNIKTYRFVSCKKTDENLTEEERAAAWKEFENEKKGFMATFDNSDIQG